MLEFTSFGAPGTVVADGAPAPLRSFVNADVLKSASASAKVHKPMPPRDDIADVLALHPWVEEFLRAPQGNKRAGGTTTSSHGGRADAD